MEEHPELVKRMVDEGHIIGNHTWHHPDLAKVTKEKFNEELTLIEDKYKELTGKDMVRYLRPPEGHFNQQMLDWQKNVDTIPSYGHLLIWIGMWINKKGRLCLSTNFRSHASGAIILMHSISSDNAECLDKLIPELRRQGYELNHYKYLMTHEIQS